MSASRCLSFVVAAIGVLLAIDVAGGCTSFQAAEAGDGAVATDSGAAETSTSEAGIRCGSTRCAPPDVCCFEADAGTESCTTKESCTGAPLECITTVDCVDAGTPSGTVCCGYDDKTRLTRSTCVQGSACDPSGPRNWLCDPRLAAGSECTQPGYASCTAYLFPAPESLAYCAPP